MVLLKSEKDARESDSYRLISLMTADAKILAKVIARRLHLVILYVKTLTCILST